MTESDDKEKEFVREIRELRNSGTWNNQLSDIVLPVIGTLHNCIIVVYTSFERCPVITFAPSKVTMYNKAELPVLFLGYNGCLGHEHYSQLEPIKEKSDLITVGEYEERELQQQDKVAHPVEEPSDMQDKYGRGHLKYPHTGPILVYLRNNIFHGSTCLEHVNDLFPICSNAVKDGKGVFIAFVDNGPDYNPTSVKNILLYGRLWKLSGLDVLCVGSHAAGESAYNDIEHGWALLSLRLTSVTLSATVEGEELPPCKNSKLSDQEKRAKEAVI